MGAGKKIGKFSWHCFDGDVIGYMTVPSPRPSPRSGGERETCGDGRKGFLSADDADRRRWGAGEKRGKFSRYCFDEAAVGYMTVHSPRPSLRSGGERETEPGSQHSITLHRAGRR